MLLDIALISLWTTLSVYAGLRYVEQRQWWTLRLKLSRLNPGRSLVISVTVTIFAVLWKLVKHYDARSLTIRVCFGIIATSFIVGLFRLLLPVAESRDYVNLRWKAWTGPSRTGIPASFARYIGDEQDWVSLSQSCQVTSSHPVERFLRVTSPFTLGLCEDPSDLLKTRQAMDEAADTVWVPRSPEKVGVYTHLEPEQSVSLLWGRQTGFRPRCSRGIISVPITFLSFQPRLKNGLDGRPVCLAHAILARNKGLRPHLLVCNLSVKQSYAQFEENSVFWPRPSKTLRSFYHAELARSFSGLGESYITAATELALLLADADHATVSDWLDRHMEHQDLELNNEVAGLGATSEDLSRLYRAQYATMLVSLSLHRPGIRIRPELALFRALSRAEGIVLLPQWLRSGTMYAREQEERLVLGRRGQALVDAVV